MLNSIILMGRLTADPELKTTQSNLPVVSFCLAVERNFADKSTGKREADFVDIVAWRSTADFVSRYFKKGQLVAVQGSLQSRKWQDGSGNNRVSWEVQADSVYFAETRREVHPADRRSEAPRSVMSRDDALGISVNEYSAPENFQPVPGDDLPF